MTEATRDLKMYVDRLLDARLTDLEARLRPRFENLDGDLQGVQGKLDALRLELRQSLRDQALWLAGIVLGGLALAVAALVFLLRG
jgi:hypothetical protein